MRAKAKSSSIVVFYLLSLSWASVFSSLPSYNRFVKGDKTLKYFAIVQSYILFAFALAILIRAPTFGSTPLCNSNAKAVIFRPFSALHGGRIAATIVVAIVIASQIQNWLILERVSVTRSVLGLKMSPYALGKRYPSSFTSADTPTGALSQEARLTWVHTGVPIFCTTWPFFSII